MSEMREFIEDTTEKILRDLSTKETRERFEEGEWSKPLWKAVQESGLTYLGVDEDSGGVGGDSQDIFSILRIAGKYAAPLPLAEVIYANQFLAKVNGEVDDKLRVLHLCEEGEDTLFHVPYARFVDEIIVVSPSGYERVNASEMTYTSKANLAAEPRDLVQWNKGKIGALTVPFQELKEDYERYLTMSRVAMMTGAMESILALTVFYSKERQQFGRPLHRFQAIQHHLTAIAGEVAAAYATFEATVAVYEKDTKNEKIAMAKIEISSNSNVVAKAAHQLHAGIGMTYEHELHHFTRRLWSWREEAGNETYWANHLADLYLTREETIWEAITEVRGVEVNVGSTV
ncbi:MAG: acyl-CoA dehydrogenase family protein [Psychrobacillus sp.]